MLAAHAPAIEPSWLFHVLLETLEPSWLYLLVACAAFFQCSPQALGEADTRHARGQACQSACRGHHLKEVHVTGQEDSSGHWNLRCTYSQALQVSDHLAQNAHS